MAPNQIELVHFLLAHQVLTPSDVIDTGVRLLDDKRDRFVLSTLAIGGQPSYMIKRARYPEVIESLHQELRAYRYINNNTQLDSVVPSLIAEDLQHGLLVIKWIDGAVSVNMHLSPEEAADRLGVLIGRLHAYTQESSNEIGSLGRPWILSSLSHHPKWRPPELDTILARTDHADILANGLKHGHHAWRPDALIHGDLKWEHYLLDPNQDETPICLIDWELATFGDSAWDVASIISDIMFGSQYGRGEIMSSVQEIIQTGEAGAFLQSYAQQRPFNNDFLERVALYTGARLFQTSLESASAYGLGEESGVDTLLAMAVDVFRDPNGFSMALSRRFMQ